MPIDLDIHDHEVLGPMLRAEREEGRREGRQEGVLAILRRQTAKRFGNLPNWAAEKLASLSAAELLGLIERVLDARSVEDLLR